MSETAFPPFLKREDYKSKDKDNPDKIQITVTALETFETQYGVNINVLVDVFSLYWHVNIYV